MAISRFFGFRRRAGNTFFHVSSSLTNKNYQEARRRIQEAAKSQTESLSLANLKLTTLPSELFRLTHLQSLNLSNNQLLLSPKGRRSALPFRVQELPPEIRHLQKLQYLYLSYNQLRNLPPEIFQLKKLRWLNLNSNQLSFLPSEIGKLTDLEMLYVGSNQLSFLPSEIGKLRNLKSLYLNHNQLLLSPKGRRSALPFRVQKLPSEVRKLTKLELLSLGNNKLLLCPLGYTNFRLKSPDSPSCNSLTWGSIISPKSRLKLAS